MIAIILKYRNLFIGLAGFLILTGLYFFIRQQGINACKDEYTKQLILAQEKAQKEIRVIEDKYAKIHKSLPKEDSGYGVGPITRSVFDSVPERIQ